jgi:hypothetical protein
MSECIRVVSLAGVSMVQYYLYLTSTCITTWRAVGFRYCIPIYQWLRTHLGHLLWLHSGVNRWVKARKIPLSLLMTVSLVYCAISQDSCHWHVLYHNQHDVGNLWRQQTNVVCSFASRFIMRSLTCATPDTRQWSNIISKLRRYLRGYMIVFLLRCQGLCARYLVQK